MDWKLYNHELVIVVAKLVKQIVELVVLNVLRHVSCNNMLRLVLGLINGDTLSNELIHLFHFLQGEVRLSKIVNHNPVIERKLELMGHS